MFVETPGKYDDVVEIREADAGDEASKDDRHQTLIGGRRITEAEGHFDHLEESDVRDEGGLLDVGRRDRHLVVSHREVERREHGGAGEGVECLIESRQRKTVELRRLVNAAVVDAHPPGTVLLFTITTGDAHGDVEGRAMSAVTSLSISFSITTRCSPYGTRRAGCRRGRESPVSIS